jgi:hypothetical protein
MYIGCIFSGELKVEVSTLDVTPPLGILRFLEFLYAPLSFEPVGALEFAIIEPFTPGTNITSSF